VCWEEDRELLLSVRRDDTAEDRADVVVGMVWDGQPRSATVVDLPEHIREERIEGSTV
jgi:hypothetical protein